MNNMNSYTIYLQNVQNIDHAHLYLYIINALPHKVENDLGYTHLSSTAQHEV